VEEAWELAALVAMANRPKIPAAIQRAIKEEAGYRCAVPTCRDKGPFDFEHIDPWASAKKHEEHNIVLLCVSCHARVTRGEINKRAIKNYKRNLAIISGRYSLYEMRLLELYYIHTSLNEEEEVLFNTEAVIFIKESEKLHFTGLLKDDYIELSRMKTTEEN